MILDTHQSNHQRKKRNSALFAGSQTETYLIPPGSTLKSRTTKIKCTQYWPCKRMTCSHCKKRRRHFFVQSGVLFALEKNLTEHLTLSWIPLKNQDSWRLLSQRMGTLAKALSGVKPGPYIRVCSIGPRKCPHVHFLVSKETARKICLVAKRKWPRRSPISQTKVFNPEGLLGYFFDHNFLPSFLDSERIRRMRLISASRPMICGFPTFLQEKCMWEKVRQAITKAPPETKEHPCAV